MECIAGQATRNAQPQLSVTDMALFWGFCSVQHRLTVLQVMVWALWLAVPLLVTELSCFQAVAKIVVHHLWSCLRNRHCFARRLPEIVMLWSDEN